MKTAIDKPDRMTFDLDPGEGVGWPQMQEAAQLVRAFLERAGPAGVPQDQRRQGPARGRAAEEAIRLGHGQGFLAGDRAASGANHSATASSPRAARSNRVGKIFIDYLRNGFGATTVCAWSARARPGLGISVPVRWDELARLKSGAHWTVGTVHTRLDEGNAPWADYEASRTGLSAAMKALGFRRS